MILSKMNITETLYNYTKYTEDRYQDDINWLRTFGIVVVCIFIIFSFLSCLKIKYKK
jgi:hypothetical protein